MQHPWAKLHVHVYIEALHISSQEFIHDSFILLQSTCVIMMSTLCMIVSFLTGNFFIQEKYLYWHMYMYKLSIKVHSALSKSSFCSFFGTLYFTLVYVIAGCVTRDTCCVFQNVLFLTKDILCITKDILCIAKDMCCVPGMFVH